MSKQLYFREQSLEKNLMNTADWDMRGYIPPMQFNARHGQRSVGEVFRTIPDGPFATSVNVSVMPDTTNSMWDNETNRMPELMIALLAGFYLFAR